MKNSVITVTAAVALCMVSCKKEEKIITTTTKNDTTVVTVPIKDTVNDKPMDSIAMMEAWKDYATPGEQHKMLADETGKWDAQITMWAPDGKETKSAATANFRMLLGGRYQESVYKGTMMGTPFEGISTTAFNNKTGAFTSTWIDNGGTGMMVTTGNYDEVAKVINYKGEMTDPMDGEKVSVREMYTFTDDRTRKMEMFDTKGGKERKSMEIVLTKK